MWSFSPRLLMLVLILTNLVNYIDRGIIPGAADHFDDFIDDTTSGRSTSTYFGALQSGFIVGFSVGSVVVGHLVHTRPPFKLAAVGLALWCLSAFAAGMSRQLGSYGLLLTARMVSGVGEAGFITVGGPYIQDEAGIHQGKWLGAFYAAIPCGTAIGYGYATMIADGINWSWCFFILIFCMAPLALALASSKDDGSKAFHNAALKLISASDDEEEASYSVQDIVSITEEEEEEKVSCSQQRTANALDISSVQAGNNDQILKKSPGVWEEMSLCLRQPTFIWVSLGYAGYSGSLIGFSTFAPSILVGLGLWNSMSSASISFSVTLAAAGIVGTPIGGLCLDLWTRRPSNLRKDVPALEFSLLTIGIGLILVALAANARNQPLFLALLLFGAMSLFAATAAMNVAIFESVPRVNRAFGQACAVMIMHGFGDVPTPILVGILKDKYAPACAVTSHGGIEDDDRCDKQQTNLRLIGTGCACWLFFSMLAFSIALFKARAIVPSRKKSLLRDPATFSPLPAADSFLPSTADHGNHNSTSREDLSTALLPPSASSFSSDSNHPDDLSDAQPTSTMNAVHATRRRAMSPSS